MKKFVLLLILPICINAVKAQEIINSDSTDMETNTSFIHLDTAMGNVWQIGTSDKAFFGVSYSPPYSIMTDTINYYPINNLSRFTVELTDSTAGIPSIELGFWHKYETDSLKDGGYVEISVDSGATWKNVARWDIAPIEAPQNFYSAADTIEGNISAFTGIKSNWEYSKYYFQFFIPVLMHGQPSAGARGIGETYTHKVMFRFNFKSDSIEINKAGWIIDNVTLKEYSVMGGIHENTLADFDVQLFPNPVNEQGIIQVTSEKNEHDFTVRIHTNEGKLIAVSKMDKNNQYVLRANELKPGMYFYSVYSKSGGIRSGKIIIK